jgi:hypothetical protein
MMVIMMFSVCDKYLTIYNGKINVLLCNKQYTLKLLSFVSDTSTSEYEADDDGKFIFECHFQII